MEQLQRRWPSNTVPEVCTPLFLCHTAMVPIKAFNHANRLGEFISQRQQPGEPGQDAVADTCIGTIALYKGSTSTLRTCANLMLAVFQTLPLCLESGE